MNSLHIDPMEFYEPRTKEKRYGYAAYDDADDTFCIDWDHVPDDDMEVLRRIIKQPVDQRMKDMLEAYAKDHYNLAIGGAWYSWGQVAHLFKEMIPA